METQHIRYFVAICEELNFTSAAQKCGISQPTITVAMKRLEQTVGGALFLRLPRPPYVELTTLGLQLYLICVEITELLAKAQSISGQVTMAANTAPAKQLPDTLSHSSR